MSVIFLIVIVVVVVVVLCDSKPGFPIELLLIVLWDQ